mgnify:CR=1 FL=1
MSALHLIFSQQGLASCELLKTDQDKVILLGDGVYCAITAPSADRSFQFHILKDDFDARGLKAKKGLCFISYDQMVELCAQSTPIVSWNA